MTCLVGGVVGRLLPTKKSWLSIERSAQAVLYQQYSSPSYLMDQEIRTKR